MEGGPASANGKCFRRCFFRSAFQAWPGRPNALDFQGCSLGAWPYAIAGKLVTLAPLFPAASHMIGSSSGTGRTLAPAITQPLAFSPQNSEKSRLSRSSASPAGGPCASTNPLSGLQAHPQPELDHLSRMIWDEICMATHVISFHDGQWGRLLGRLTSYIWHIRITAQKI